MGSIGSHRRLLSCGGPRPTSQGFVFFEYFYLGIILGLQESYKDSTGSSCSPAPLPPSRYYETSSEQRPALNTTLLPLAFLVQAPSCLPAFPGLVAFCAPQS